MSLLEIIGRYRDAVRHVELSAFLHDLDKADNEFKGSHKHHILDNKSGDEAVKAKRWGEIFGDYDPPMPDCGILEQDLEENREFRVAVGNGKLSDAFCFHHVNKPREKGTQMVFPLTAAVVHGGICGADGIDSGLNKLQGDEKAVEKCSQKQEGAFEIATPFGKTTVFWDNSEFREKTRKLVQAGAPIRAFREHFSKVLGETRKPFNDVTLWDHSFNVAAWAKSLFAKILMEYHSGVRENGVYPLPGRDGISVLKVELDRASLLRQAHLAADIIGVNDACEEIMNGIRGCYENELAIGNEIYRDHSRMLFSFPRLTEALRQDFETELADTLSDIVAGFVGAFDLQQLPFSVTILPLEIRLDDKKWIDAAATLAPHCGKLLARQEHFTHALKPLSELSRSIHPGRVCDICQLRNAVGGRDNDDHLCGICAERRKAARDKVPADLGVLLNDPREENKLALISITAELGKLRSGASFEEVYAGRKLYPLASPDRLYRIHETIPGFFAEFLESLPIQCKYLEITRSPECLEFIIPARFIDTALDSFIRESGEEFSTKTALMTNPFHIPFKVAVIAFHQKFPLYAVIDAADGMKGYLGEDGFDFLLLDTVDLRHSFTPSGRRHHIFGRANRYGLKAFGDFERVWDYLGKLEKSQIGNIENSLIAKRLDWGERSAESEAYRAFAQMTLFSPNALGKRDCQGNEGFLLDAAVSGLLLDVIDLYIHIENRK